MLNIWDTELVVTNDTGFDQQARVTWLRAHPGVEAVTVKRALMTKKGILAVADVLAKNLTNPIMTSPLSVMVFVTADNAIASVTSPRDEQTSYYDDEFDEWYECVPSKNQDDPSPGRAFDSTRYVNMEVAITGSRTLIQHVFTELDKVFKNEKHAEVRWWFKGDRGGAAYKHIYLPPVNTLLHPSFYPDLTTDPQTYLKDYLRSDASVLLLAGPPGTGKTTLLRHLISDFNLSAHVIYDEDLMKTDKVFQTFLFEPHSDIMVIEDADTTLSNRTDGDNKMMARFLSVSDGLIKLPNKKLVFTTNLTDFSRVDSALLRPGRCFGLAHTRAFNYGEAVAAATAANLPIPERRHEYTLAELFNNSTAPEVRKVGFV